ncbi:MAG: PA2779 family protein [Gammaproteobacteria bacterium]|nr:PA2779 family protein [Gammaproteobacteria bacterium]
MDSFKSLRKMMALPLIMMLIFSTFSATVVQAKMIGTDEVISQEATSADRNKVIEFMQRDDVRAEMETLGVDPKEAVSRVHTLSDEEVQRMAGHLDEMPAGEGVVGPIVGAIVLVFLVLLLTDILCLTHVFDFAKCAR